MRETASGCVKDEIGKICSQTSRIYAALQSRPVKDPAFAFPHNQDPEQPSNSRDHALQKLQCRHVFSEPDVNLAVTIARQLGFSIESRHRPNAIFSRHANPEQKTKARDGNENNACA